MSEGELDDDVASVYKSVSISVQAFKFPFTARTKTEFLKFRLLMNIQTIDSEASIQMRTLLKSSQEYAERSNIVIEDIAKTSMESAEKLHQMSRQIHEVDHSTSLASHRSQQAQAKAEDIMKNIDSHVQQIHQLVETTEETTTANSLDIACILQRLQSLHEDYQTTSTKVEQNANDMILLQRDMRGLSQTVRHDIIINDK